MCYLLSYIIISLLEYVRNFCTLIANEAVKNLKLFKRKQSILITGLSGSGKTENCKHIVKFLRYSSNSQYVVDFDYCLEAFGNATTHQNTNSSRFCKHIEVLF